MTIGNLFGISSGSTIKNSASNKPIPSQSNKWVIKRGAENFKNKVSETYFRKNIGSTVRVGGKEIGINKWRGKLIEMVGREKLDKTTLGRRLKAVEFDGKKERVDGESQKKTMAAMKKIFAKESIGEMKKSGGLTIFNKKSPEKPPVAPLLRARYGSIVLKTNKHNRVTRENLGSKQTSVGQSGQTEVIANPNRPEASQFAAGYPSGGGQASVDQKIQEKVAGIGEIGRPAKFGKQDPANDKPTNIKLVA